MTRIRLLVGMAAVVLAAACSSATTPEAIPTGDGQLSVAWTSDLRPVEPPAAAASGFVFHALSAQRQFEMVSVSAMDGRVRWRSPASPSRVDHGTGLHAQTAQDGRTVLWMEPGRVYRDGDVSLVAADAATGQRRWSYGSGRLRVRSAPSVCRGGTSVCLTAYLAGAEDPRAVVLDARSGRVVSDRDTPFQGSVRNLDGDLYAAGGRLAAVDDQGKLVWYRDIAEAFRSPKADPDYGWNIQHGDGRYVGSLGRTRPQGAATVDLAGIAATAAFDARTGRTLWTRPKAGVFCGQLEFDLAHPVLCSFTGTANADLTKLTNLGVTLTGIDPATGKDRWQAKVGNVQSLLKDGDDLIRTGRTTYTLRTAQGLAVLDLDRGPQPGPAPDTGWCSTHAEAVPTQNVTGVNRGDPTAYSVNRWHPCRIGGTALDRPTRAGDFLNATTNGVLAYTTNDGTIRAVRTG